MLRPFNVLNLLRSFSSFWQLPALVLAVLGLASCESTSPKIEGVPSNLPDIPLYGSASTPPHSMSKGDYPFDSSGNYVTAWAAQGGASGSGASSGHSEEMPPEPAPVRRSTRGGLSKVETAPPEIKSTYTPKSSSHKAEEESAASRSKGGAPKASTSKVKEDDKPTPKKKPSGSNDSGGSVATKKKTPTDDSPKKKASSDEAPKKKPSSSGGASKHVVKSSDTVESIARKYGTTPAKIKKANNMKSDVIRDGSTLVIPK